MAKGKIDRIARSKGLKITYPKFVISFNNKFKVIWDIIVLLLIVCLSIYIPYEIGFDVHLSITFDYFVLAFFLIDILVNLRTTYINLDKEEIINCKKIALNYIKSINFAIDLLSALPFSEFIKDDQID